MTKSDVIDELPNITELRERIRILKRTLRALKDKQRGSKNIHRIRSASTSATIDIDNGEDRIAILKDLCVKRKHEISEWKTWYNGLNEEERVLQFDQLNHEISWRGKEIESSQSEVSMLNTRLLKLQDKVHLQNQIDLPLAADRPESDHDPRIARVIEALEQVQSELTKLESNSSRRHAGHSRS